MSNPVDELEWEGDQIANGRYHIKELLGSSMALVYRADQELILQKEPLVREVVIKTPRPRLLDDSTGLTERFQREIRALIHLTQPNIVRILDAGVHAIHHNERTQAWPFAVMEYLAGGNLHRNCCIDDRTSSCLPQELDRLADWLNPLAHALDFIHAQGYVHRDVKPENILFDGGGHVYLSDFGIVAALSAQDHSAFSSWKTKAGFVLGTPEYMAPELAKGEGLDGRVDQYSLGVVVHQLLCGRLPFEAPTPVALMVKHAHEAPPRLSDLQPSIPAHVSNIVLQALSKNPADRFLDCRSFVEALLTKRESVKPVGPDPIDPQPVIESEVQDTIVQDLGKGLLILQQKVLDSSKWIRDTTQTVFARVAEIWRTALVKAPQEPNATSESRPQSSKRQQPPPNDTTDSRTTATSRRPHASVGWKVAVRTVLLPSSDDSSGKRRARIGHEKAINLPEVTSDEQDSRQLRHELASRATAVALLLITCFFAVPIVVAVLISIAGPEVQTIRIAMTDATVNEGSNTTFSVSATYDDGTERDVTDLARADSPYVEIVARGKLKAKSVSANETARITVALDGKEESHTITVCNVPRPPIPVIEWPPRAEGIVGFSPDGRKILTHGDTCAAMIWDADTVELLRTFGDGAHGGYALAFTPDGTRILTGHSDSAVLWDVETGEKSQEFSHRHLGYGQKLASTIAMSADGRRVLTGADHVAVLWDAQTGRKLRAFNLGAGVNAVAIHPDGRQVLAGSAHTAILWDTESGKKIRSFDCRGSVSTVAFGRNGDRIATGASWSTFVIFTDGEVVIWDARTGEQLQTLDCGGTLRGFELATDARRALTHEYSETVLWNAETGKRLSTLPSGKLTPDGDRILSFSSVLDAETGRNLRTYQQLHFGKPQQAESIVFSRNGSRLMTRSESGTTIWSLDGSPRVRLLPHSRTISINGDLLLSTAGDTAVLWDAETGQRQHTFEHGDDVNAVAFDPRGKSVLTGSDDNKALLWDADSGTKLQTLSTRADVNVVAFSPSGKRVLTAAEKVTTVWDLETAESLQSFTHDGRVWSAGFSPDGSTIFAKQRDRVTLNDPTNGASRRVLKHDDDINAVAFDLDGQRVLTGSDDNTAILWDVKTGRRLHTLKHKYDVEVVAFHPRGKLMLTASAETAILWETTSGRELHTLTHDRGVLAVAFGVEHSYVVTSTYYDGALHLWDIESGEKLAKLYSMMDNEWLAITPTGYFDGTKRARGVVAYDVEGSSRHVPADEMDEQFHRPGLFADIRNR